MDKAVNQTKIMLRRLNDALPGLVMGIIAYGVVVELVCVWFVSDRLYFTIGLCIGIALACGMAVNMATVLLDAVDGNGQSGAQARIIAKSILRYLLVVLVFFVMMKFNLGSLAAAFVGVFGLKISAYLQPVARKILLRLQGRGGVSSDNK